MMFGTREEFEYFQCLECSCLQISQIPADLARYYPRSYYSLSHTVEETCTNNVFSLLQKARCKNALFGRGYKVNKLLKPFVPLPKALYRAGPMLKRAGIRDYDAAFLDVGCGASSWWLNALRQLGFHRLTGVDPMIENDVHINGVDIFKKTLADISGAFSLITFHHSFEHIAEQQQMLQLAVDRLQPDGWCLIRIPIVSSYAWERYGVNWVEMDPPRHLYLHSLKSIELMAVKAGLELIDVAYDSIALEFYGSEQYLRDIPLNDERSYWANPNTTLFTQDDVERFESMARLVNESKVGGRAAFYFRRRSAAQLRH